VASSTAARLRTGVDKFEDRRRELADAVGARPALLENTFENNVADVPGDPEAIRQQNFGIPAPKGRKK